MSGFHTRYNTDGSSALAAEEVREPRSNAVILDFSEEVNALRRPAFESDTMCDDTTRIRIRSAHSRAAAHKTPLYSSQGSLKGVPFNQMTGWESALFIALGTAICLLIVLAGA